MFSENWFIFTKCNYLAAGFGVSISNIDIQSF